MLGTNDLKTTFGLSVDEIASHLEKTIKFIQNDENAKTAKILIICPPFVAYPNKMEIDERMKNAPKNSRDLPRLYEQIASKNGCMFLNAAELFTLENTDGYHLAAKHHKILGEKVYDIIKAQKNYS
jgi:lysophospholipase L1-like esterase